MFWRKWVGLPWALGADPRSGRAACCFRTAQAVREELGLPWPTERMETWYDRARQADWANLRSDWQALTAEVRTPGTGALARFDNPDGSFGVGILVEPDLLITVRHHGRLIVAPRRAIGSIKLYQLA